MSDRRSRILRGADATRGRGLEIGPLNSPIATKDQLDVVYTDLHDAAGLRDVYSQHPGLAVEEIVEVDYPLVDETGLRSLAAATGDAGPFDWVIASHVVEHVPDLIGWLREVAQVMVAGGKLSLVIPDRRYTFDARRPPTTVGQMLQAHLDADAGPSARAVFDHFSEAVSISREQAWSSGPPGPEARIHDLSYARSMAEKSAADGTYVDCHVWLFTPAEFVEQMMILAEMDLFDFTIDSLTPTDAYDVEFFATLSMVPREGRCAQRAHPAAHSVVVAEPCGASTGVLTVLSHRERRVIDAKRRAMTWSRRHLRRS